MSNGEYRMANLECGMGRNCMPSNDKTVRRSISLFLISTAIVGSARAAEPEMDRKTCKASDGVTLVYCAAGQGDTSLVFIHGGLADRSFYDARLRAFADRFRVVA